MTRSIWLLNSHRKCPYCNGRLVRAIHKMYHFDCTTCDRGWKVDEDGTWYALFDASNTTYSKEYMKNLR